MPCATAGSSFTRRKDGLLSDNIGQVFDDGESLWLSTTRGICRIAKSQLREFSAGKRSRLEPQNYGVEDGLRSAQCARLSHGGGGIRTADGRLWFTTGRGLAVLDPRCAETGGAFPGGAPGSDDGQRPAGGSGRAARLAPGSERLQIRYTGIHLSAPERVQYFLQAGRSGRGLGGGRRPAGDRLQQPAPRALSVQRASQLPGGPAAKQSYSFEMLPQFWETAWFRLLCLAHCWRGRGRCIRLRCARSARGSRWCWKSAPAGARDSRHAGAGIRRHFLAAGRGGHVHAGRDGAGAQVPGHGAAHGAAQPDRGAAERDGLAGVGAGGQDLAAALESGTRLWTAGSGVDVAVEVSGPGPKSAGRDGAAPAAHRAGGRDQRAEARRASRIGVKLHLEARRLHLRIVDNGRGFDQQDVFSSQGRAFRSDRDARARRAAGRRTPIGQ
jgi:hypothetical protein